MSFRSLLILPLLGLLLSGCLARLNYDVPATIAVDQGSHQAALVASQRIEEALGAKGDFGPGDLVRISFPYMPALDTQQRIQPSGFISPPLLDPIQTRGLTTLDMQRILEDKYRSRLRHPHVSVALLEYNRPPTPPELFVLGEVIKPGPIEYRDGMTLVEAIARAGGANRQANLGKIVVIEPQGGQLAANMVDFDAVLSGRAGQAGRVVPVLGPYAVVIVPPTNLVLSADRSHAIRTVIGFSGFHTGVSTGLKIFE